MANGESVPIQGYGKIEFMSDRQESKALYILEFPSNLLSVGKLTNALNCNVIFSPNSAVIHDRLMGRTIGEGNFSHGLYFSIHLIWL